MLAHKFAPLVCVEGSGEALLHGAGDGTIVERSFLLLTPPPEDIASIFVISLKVGSSNSKDALLKEELVVGRHKIAEFNDLRRCW